MTDEELDRIEAEVASLSFAEAVARLDELHDEGRGDSDEAEVLRNCPAFEAGRVILAGGELTLVEGDPPDPLRADLAEALALLREARDWTDDFLAARIDTLLARHPDTTEGPR